MTKWSKIALEKTFQFNNYKQPKRSHFFLIMSIVSISKQLQTTETSFQIPTPWVIFLASSRQPTIFDDAFSWRSASQCLTQKPFPWWERKKKAFPINIPEDGKPRSELHPQYAEAKGVYFFFFLVLFFSFFFLDHNDTKKHGKTT